MLCFLPPVPAIRPEPLPERGPPQPARAAQAVILIFVILNVLFVMTGMLPLLVKMETRHDAPTSASAVSDLCRERRAVALPETERCRKEQRASHP